MAKNEFIKIGEQIIAKPMRSMMMNVMMDMTIMNVVMQRENK